MHTFAVGHLALSYFAGKISSKALGTNINLPLILTLSVLPDVDLFLEPILRHGGPTHSLIMLTVLFLPIILIWKKASIPYFAAIVSHPLIGDYLTRTPPRETGVQLLFPLNSTWFLAGLENSKLMYAYSEIIIFIAFLSLLVATRDIKSLTKAHASNFLLIIPLLTAALPVLIDFPIHVLSELVIPHLALMALLTIPIMVDLRSYIRKTAPQ